jgi:hypothetical protein
MRFYNIERGYELTKAREWKRWYVAVDLHDTICKPDYGRSGSMGDFFPGAVEALKHLSDRKDVGLLLFTCSYRDELYSPKGALEILRNMGIRFDYVNENPEAPNTKLGDFSRKPFFNVLLDDKAGFDGADWPKVLKVFQSLPDLMEADK